MDWAARYRDEDTPWDLGAPHPELVRRLAAGELRAAAGSALALVPGCGRGHDALALARAGWSVTALDLVALRSPALDELARCGGELVVGDALAFGSSEPRGPFELVLDHTFFCALPRERRGDWGRLVERSLAAGGRLACLVFPVGKAAEEGGPPFGSSAADLAAALGAGFALEDDEPVLAGAAGRKWGERWALFRRTRPGGAR